jgi:TetR/AcrR family transcriptional regulator, transcriptional repressor for nem operon
MFLRVKLAIWKLLPKFVLDIRLNSQLADRIMGRTSDAKERLMAAATELIWEDSYGAVTIDDICKRADVRKGSFYYYFPGKAELAITAIEDLWTREWKPFLDQHLSPERDPAERVRGYLEAVVAVQSRLAEQHGKVLGCPACSIGSEICNNQPAVATAIREVFAKKRRYYESTIRDAVASGAMPPCDPAEMANAFFGLVNGLVAQARIMNDIKILRHLPDLGLSLLKLNALTAA